MWLLCLYSFCYIERQKLKDTTLYISLFRQSGSTVHWLQIIQITRKRSWRKAYARQRRHSKMAVSRHLGFCRTANSAIRSANPENHSLEANMEWIRCTVCEIFAFKLYCDLETGVRGHSRSWKAALFDRTHTTLYSSSIVTICLYLLPFPRYSHILVENRYPPCIWLWVTPSDLRNYPWRRKTRMMGLSRSMKEFRWYIQSFWYKSRVWQTDGQTDRQTDEIGVAYTRCSICWRA